MVGSIISRCCGEGVNFVSTLPSSSPYRVGTKISTPSATLRVSISAPKLVCIAPKFRLLQPQQRKTTESTDKFSNQKTAREKSYTFPLAVFYSTNELPKKLPSLLDKYFIFSPAEVFTPTPCGRSSSADARCRMLGTEPCHLAEYRLFYPDFANLVAFFYLLSIVVIPPCRSKSVRHQRVVAGWLPLFQGFQPLFQ